jgi:pimeloyl-ACP methyl ester carboxylesterase
MGASELGRTFGWSDAVSVSCAWPSPAGSARRSQEHPPCFRVARPVDLPPTGRTRQRAFNDVRNGNTSKDVSQILTHTLALNTSGPLAGHINTGIGVSGHSLGGMITHGLLTAWPDSRIISANPQSCEDMGNPAASVSAKVLFVHGDRDPTTSYSSARQAYTEMT